MDLSVDLAVGLSGDLSGDLAVGLSGDLSVDVLWVDFDTDEFWVVFLLPFPT